jgi:hypothetical protein
VPVSAAKAKLLILPFSVNPNHSGTQKKHQAEIESTPKITFLSGTFAHCEAALMLVALASNGVIPSHIVAEFNPIQT